MKSLFTVLFACSLTLFCVNCGSDDDGGCDQADACGDDGGDDNVGPADNTAPLHSPSAGILEFSTAYISGTSCAQVRGNLPGLTWTAGADLGSEADGYRGVSYQMTAGTYEISYVGWADCSSRAPDVWADYGKKENLAAMSPGARAFVQCNWWNGSATVSVGSPSCNLKISVDASGNVSPAGNMVNYAGQ